MRTLFLAMLCALLLSCGTREALIRFEDSQARYELGQLTSEEFRAEMIDAIAEMDARQALLLDRLEDQRDEIPSDPISLLIYLASLATTAVVGGAGVTKYRDRNRRLRGEDWETPSKPQPRTPEAR